MIIDFHTHTFPDKVAPKAIGKLAVISGITPYTDGTVADTLASQAKTGVDLCVCLNIATAPGQETTINNTAAALCEDHKGRLIAFGSVHPDSPDALDELARIKALGIPGVKLHHDYQNFIIDEDRMDTLYDTLAQLQIPTVFHAGWDCYSPDLIHCPPERAAKVAKRHPKLTMILAHLGGMKRWDDVLEHVAGIPNVYMDTSMAASCNLSYELAGKILAKHPKENILLGSDCPWEDPTKSIAWVEELPVSDDRKEAILGGNAMKLLGL